VCPALGGEYCFVTMVCLKSQTACFGEATFQLNPFRPTTVVETGSGATNTAVAPLRLDVRRSAMAESDCQNPHPSEWRFLYRASILETNSFKKAKRISDTEAAIAERRRELSRETRADVEGEIEAMDEAMYALRAWKSALENGTHAA
jgi:hypothetical protein